MGFDVNDKGGATTRETTQSPSLNYTPLHMAAEGLHPDVVQLLVDYGANVSSQNHEGKSPLHYAIPSQKLSKDRRTEFPRTTKEE